jgi:polyhydroxyalkanoate synthesis regulator phasin
MQVASKIGSSVLAVADMSDRVQLNVRLEKYPRLIDLLKSQAKQEGSSVNDLVVRVLAEHLGLEAEQTPIVQVLNRISALEERLEKLENASVGEPLA